MVSRGVHYNVPTECVRCHKTVRLWYYGDADPFRGHWTCPECGYTYPFIFWKIQTDKNYRPNHEDVKP